jgi:hypothetical protein
MIEKQTISVRDTESGENDLTCDKHERWHENDLSRKILKKWQSGVIICPWPKFFWDEDDIEMR